MSAHFKNWFCSFPVDPQSSPNPFATFFFSPDNYTCYYCNQESKADKVRKDKVKIMIDVCIIYAQTVLKCETEMLISCSKKGYIKINYIPILPARSDFEN